jgi:hypothetical protein
MLLIQYLKNSKRKRERERERREKLQNKLRRFNILE